MENRGTFPGFFLVVFSFCSLLFDLGSKDIRFQIHPQSGADSNVAAVNLNVAE